MPRSTFHDQFHILVNKGYLVNTHGNTYDFYEKPNPSAVKNETERTTTELNFEDDLPRGFYAPPEVKNEPQDNIEINNRYKINKINTDTGPYIF